MQLGAGRAASAPEVKFGGEQHAERRRGQVNPDAVPDARSAAPRRRCAPGSGSSRRPAPRSRCTARPARRRTRRSSASAGKTRWSPAPSPSARRRSRFRRRTPPARPSFPAASRRPRSAASVKRSPNSAASSKVPRRAAGELRDDVKRRVRRGDLAEPPEAQRHRRVQMRPRAHPPRRIDQRDRGQPHRDPNQRAPQIGVARRSRRGGASTSITHSPAATMKTPSPAASIRYSGQCQPARAAPHPAAGITPIFGHLPWACQPPEANSGYSVMPPSTNSVTPLT